MAGDEIPKWYNQFTTNGKPNYYHQNHSERSYYILVKKDSKHTRTVNQN